MGLLRRKGEVNKDFKKMRPPTMKDIEDMERQEREEQEAQQEEPTPQEFGSDKQEKLDMLQGHIVRAYDILEELRKGN